MHSTLERVIGIDLGTGGLRAMAVDLEGRVLGVAEASVGGRGVPDARGWHEQDARGWERALEQALGELVCSLPARHRVRAIACCGTSGTILPVDREGRPTGPARLYNDRRAAEETEACTRALGHPVGWSFGLPRMVGLERERRLIGAWGEGPRYLHAVDFLNEWLVGEPVPTDFTSALKSGWSPATRSWPSALFGELGLGRGQVAAVVAPGTRIGTLRRDIAERWDLPLDVAVVAGATDANAAFYASGARRPGEWNSALGSTLAVRGQVGRELPDEAGRFYHHLHPDGGWLLAGASNVGVPGVARAVEVAGSGPPPTAARVPGTEVPPVAARLPGTEVPPFAARVPGTEVPPFAARVPGTEVPPIAARVPGTEVPPFAARVPEALCYPLAGVGERLPFVSPQARALWTSAPRNPTEARLAARLGLALVERWIYDLLVSLGAPAPTCVHATGGTARDEEWLSMRAGVLGCPVARVLYPDSAFGAAVLAVSWLRGEGVGDVSGRMCRSDQVFEPDPTLTEWARGALPRLQAAIRAQGWLT